MKQKDQKVGKYEDGSEPVVVALIEMHQLRGRRVAFEWRRVTSLRQGIRRLLLPPPPPS